MGFTLRIIATPCLMPQLRAQKYMAKYSSKTSKVHKLPAHTTNKFAFQRAFGIQYHEVVRFTVVLKRLYIGETYRTHRAIKETASLLRLSVAIHGVQMSEAFKVSLLGCLPRAWFS
eukprot:5561261-Pleurochrysis_carterae.AAC.1